VTYQLTSLAINHATDAVLMQAYFLVKWESATGIGKVGDRCFDKMCVHWVRSSFA